MLENSRQAIFASTEFAHFERESDQVPVRYHRGLFASRFRISGGVDAWVLASGISSSSPAGPTGTSKTRFLVSCFATPGGLVCGVWNRQLLCWARITHSAVKAGSFTPSTSIVTTEVTCTAVSRCSTVLVSERARTRDPIVTGSPKRIDSNP